MGFKGHSILAVFPALDLLLKGFTIATYNLTW